MGDALFYLDSDSGLSLQNQIRQKIVDGITSGSFPPGHRLPSSRKLAEQIGISRNTVVLAYEQLQGEGFLESRERSGVYVCEDVLEGRVGYSGPPAGDSEPDDRWQHRIRTEVGQRPRFEFPGNWQQHPFPFIDGQYDSSLYPTAQWREASRMALGAPLVRQGTVTEGDADDPALIEEIRSKMLPRRGINARAEEILITLGEQNALYLLTQLLTDHDTSVVVEEPGNPKFRQLLNLRQARIIPQPVDENGMIISKRLDDAQLVYVTPSHQVPTAATMATQRRQALLKNASRLDQLIIEDDFEHESNFLGKPHPALRGMDRENRVVYISALPKVLAPGLRIGFIVAAPELIRQARRLRQQVIGRPSLLNQRTAALFLSLGHYDSFMSRMHQEMSRRWVALRDGLNHYRANFVTMPNQGGSVFWVRCPDEIDVEILARKAARRGILIEPDTHYYARDKGSRNCFRLGVTSIPQDRIRQGVEKLRELMWELSSGKAEYLDDDDPHFLRGAELERVMCGSTWIYKTVYGDPAIFELDANGAITGRSGHADEEQDEGRWWVKGDRWYRQWKHWAYGEARGFYIRKKGQHIKIYNSDRRLVDSAVIQTQKD
jgi:GntR family transcriptional regulator/MocR family aminotransferase